MTSLANLEDSSIFFTELIAVCCRIALFGKDRYNAALYRVVTVEEGRKVGMILRALVRLGAPCNGI